MLARWLNRNGIGQFLAPDENAAQDPPPDEARADIWQILAPDPKFAPPQPPPAEIFAGEGRQVLCSHCNRWTSVDGPRYSSPVKSPPSRQPEPNDRVSGADNNGGNNGSSRSMFFTPSPTKPYPDRPISSDGGLALPDPVQSDVNRLVLDAAKETALSAFSPPQVQQTRDKLFRLCASINPLSDKLLKRISKTLTKDPTLLKARSSGLGQVCPDGCTVLMAAAYADHVAAAKIILEVAASTKTEDLHLDRDFQGRNALHYAAEGGNMEMVDFLTPLYTGFLDSTDLLGRTPLGRAIMSPVPKARRQQRELEERLFSPNNPSIFGDQKPVEERMQSFGSTLGLAYGLADMPGMRVTMEDATCEASWQQQSSDGQSNSTDYCLLGVCDGHGDHGRVSAFVASNVPSVLRDCMGSGPIDDVEASTVDYWKAIWYSTCLQLDDRLKQEDIAGGSTAVFALCTKDVIVVANVGDSRCILIQKAQVTISGDREGADSSNDTEPSHDSESNPPDLRDEQETVRLLAQSSEAEVATMTGGTTVVVALSHDHKADLPDETARIENAGLKVVAITFEDNGEEVTIHKVAKSGRDQLAVSRAFGDFEYKENTTIGPEDQAVSCIADVQVHKRDPNRDLYLVLACDGVWDVKDNESVMDFVVKNMESRGEAGSSSNLDASLLPEVGDALLKECLSEGSRDNMTTIVVSLKKQEMPVSPKTLDFGSPIEQ